MEHVFFCTGHELKIPNIIKSEGLYLYDDQGKGYMDLESGVWCTSIGHKNADINRIIKNQIDLSMHTGFCYSNKILEKSAKSIVLLNIPKDVSEFIFEPGSSSGFVRFPPKALISKIVQIVRDNGGKIIVNEVTTGIGRTGKWFGFQHYDIAPDFVAVGKGIGNGYPVSIALINKTTDKQLERKPFHYSQSHQNDPLGASIVHGVIQYIEENNLISKAESNGLLLHKHLESLVDNEIIFEVRGRGLMFAVDIKNEEITNSLYDDLIERGFIVGNRGSSFRIDPPLTIQKTEIDRFIDALKESISRYKI